MKYDAKFEQKLVADGAQQMRSLRLRSPAYWVLNRQINVSLYRQYENLLLSPQKWAGGSNDLRQKARPRVELHANFFRELCRCHLPTFGRA